MTGQMTKNRIMVAAALVFTAVAFIVIVFLIPPQRMTEPAAKLLTGMVWPFVLVLVIVIFWNQAEAIMGSIAKRIEKGAGLELGSVFKITAEAERIPEPSPGEPVTLKNVALLHTSFIPAKHPPFNDGLVYFQIEVVVVAPDAVMERIASVTYRFDEAYTADQREAITSDRHSRFKVKQLANGTSIVRAEIRFRGEKEPILHLNRFIDLRADGPRL